MRYVAAFGRFWYDLLIGDRPELFFGPVIGLALVALVIGSGWADAGGLLLFGLVVVTGGWSLVRELARSAP